MGSPQEEVGGWATGSGVKRSRGVLAGLREVAHGQRYDAGEGSLGGRLLGAEEPGEPRPAGCFCGDEDARHGAERPSSAGSPTAACSASRSGGTWRDAASTASAIGRSNPEPSLRRSGRSEIDRDPPQRPLELRAPDPTPDALLGFLAGLVRQPDDHKCGHASLKVGLHLDGPGLEAHERMGDDARQHALHRRSLRRTKPACFVPTLSQARALFAA